MYYLIFFILYNICFLIFFDHLIIWHGSLVPCFYFSFSRINYKKEITRNEEHEGSYKKNILKERSIPNKTGNVFNNLWNEMVEDYKLTSIIDLLEYSCPVFDLVFSWSFFNIRILYGVQMKNLLVCWGYFEIGKKEIWHTLWRVLSKKTVMKTYCLDVLHK